MAGHGGRRVPEDVAAATFLMAVAALAWWQSGGLPVGTLHHFGPALLPRALAALTGLLGVVLLGSAVLAPTGIALHAWGVRGPLFILGAVAAFGLGVRPLGLIVAGPVALVLASLGSADTRWQEIMVFAVAMTAFCVGLFKWALGLPIPVAPWLIGY